MPTAVEVFRDYETDGVPASGAHQVIKSQVRALLTGYEAAIGTGETTITVAGDVTVTTEAYLRLNKTVPATTNVLLPASLGRNGVDLTVKDVAGNAGSFNFALKGNGTEDVDGVTSAVGGYLGRMNYQLIRIHPRVDGTGWDVIHSG
jgi:hypothetical protein